MRVSCPPPPPPRRSGGELYAVGLFSVSILLFRLSHCFIVVSSALTRSEEAPPSVRLTNSHFSVPQSLTQPRSVSDSMVNKITGPTNDQGGVRSVSAYAKEREEEERDLANAILRSSALDKEQKSSALLLTFLRVWILPTQIFIPTFICQKMLPMLSETADKSAIASSQHI